MHVPDPATSTSTTAAPFAAFRLDAPDAPDATAGAYVPNPFAGWVPVVVERRGGRVRITRGTAAPRLPRP